MKVTFLSRPGCHLCDEALDQLKEHLGLGGGNDRKVADMVELEVVDIEADEELHRRYFELIPVILLEEEVVSELAFTSEEFDAAIDRRLQGQA